MTEWLKVPVLKTGVGIPYRGFESHSLRHVGLTRTLGSNSAAEGLFVFVAGQGDDGGVVEVDGVEEGLAEHAADGVGRLVWSVRPF